MKNSKLLFATNLTRMRKEFGFSQNNLAERTGLTHNFINDLENMKKGCSFKTLDKLSEALGVEPLQFFVDIDHWGNGVDAQFVAMVDGLRKNMNTLFDDYQGYAQTQVARG